MREHKAWKKQINRHETLRKQIGVGLETKMLHIILFHETWKV